MQLGEVAWHIAGDIGGVGISRFRFVRQDSANITGADCNTVGAASAALLGAVKSYMPIAATWSCQGQVNVYESTSGLVQGPLAMSSIPSNVVGTLGGSYGAGTGARINWKTSTLAGRRLIKGATFVVPLGPSAFTTSGAVLATFQTLLNNACTTYLNALTTAALYPVIWHRPKPGATVGGITGIAFAGLCSGTPAGLRSRRS